ncbi:histidinol-phosphate aminotransferase [Natronomonas moolapensis 8.8.11]|uniref:Histidinol-phosphate aminotransferase n=1 Tax=Natronomonas moolapensis (strain DSM 18674 / CECT 7526 / JCM 14361 / 8.8.11) TaxID=268739 RepID=M1XSG7_NATM8|nr:histidinol-phosphate transaminase [Natronomonas moolapensis]CCQ37317.1 histidinol-phosphate aminotransferase [Natronomonas moolapensis 8.8.11]
MHPRDLSDHVAYEAGRGIEEVARELGLDPDDLVKLSSNENALGPAPKAVEAIEAYAPSVHTYPKSSAADLRERLADRHGVTPAQVWLANGGDGALDYLSRALLEPGDSVLVPDPGFAYYAMSARYHHGSVNEYPIRRADDFEQSAETVLDHYDGERIVYLTSPHNPTGSEIDRADVETIAEGTAEETLSLVDEAYVEFSESPSMTDLLADREDVAVLRTFSKAYGLAGLRLGYAVVPEAWADAYARINTPFAASEVACRAGLAALEDEEFLEQTLETAAWAKEYIRDTIACPTWASSGNFVLCDVGDGTAVAEAAQREGIIVRDTTSFGLPGCVRITCGTRQGTKRAVAVLNDLL